MKHLLLAGVAILAVSAGAAAQSQPPAVNSTGPQTQGATSATPGAGTNTAATPQFMQAEAQLRDVMRQLQGNAELAPVRTQAQQALQQMDQAIQGLPAERRETQAVRNAREQVREAQTALTAANADASRARTELQQVVDALPALRRELGMTVGGAQASAEPQPHVAQAPATSGDQRTGATTPGSSGTSGSGVDRGRAESLIGTNLRGADDRDAGEVENLLIDGSGQVRAAIVEWGGFLGIGARRAVVPIDQVQLGAATSDRARLTLSREQLEQLPTYERDKLNEVQARYGWQDLRLVR